MIVTTQQLDDTYIENRACPQCHGSDLEPHHTEYGETDITQTISCAECGTIWDEIYSLAGITNIRRPGGVSWQETRHRTDY